MDNVCINIDTAGSVESQHWCLLLVVSVYIAHAQNSFYHFKTVITHAKFGLLEVAAFLESSNVLTAD